MFSEKKNIYTVSIIFFFFFFLSFNLVAKVPEKGKIIVDELSLSRDIIVIPGEWQFCFGRFASANEMEQINPNEKKYIHIPSSWNKNKEYGSTLPAFGIATYYLKIILKNSSINKYQAYGIRAGSITCAYHLYVNDSLLIESGKPTKSAKGYAPMWGPEVCYFVPQNDTVKIVLHVSNFLDPVNAGIIQPIRFGTKQEIEHNIVERNVVTVYILGSFIILFLFQLFVNFVHKEDRSHFIIALLVLCFFLNLISNGEVLLMQLFPHFDAVLEYRLWLLSYFCIPLLYKLVAINFPSDINKAFERWVFIFYFFVFLLVFVFDLSVILKYVYYVLFPTIAILIYLIVVLVKAVLKKRNYSVHFMASFFIMILLLLNDLLYMTDRLTAGYYSQFGVLLFVIVQSVITLLRFADSHKRALIITEDLRISKINLELIIEAKTEELRNANQEYETANHVQDFLISSISHDMIGLFNILLANSKALVKEPSLTGNQRSSSKKLYEAIENGYIVLEDVIGCGRQRLLKKSNENLLRNLSEIIWNNIHFYNEYIEKKAIRIDVSIDDNLCFKCDEYHMNTMIRRLLSNAIKYSLRNGHIVISNSIENGFVKISVKDEGIGIPEDVMPLLFKAENIKIRKGPYGEQGNGFGLILVEKLIESNGGEIYCLNTSPGVSFVLKFPACILD